MVRMVKMIGLGNVVRMGFGDVVRMVKVSLGMW